VGEATRWNAVSFYGMTAIGMLICFCTLAVSQRPVWMRIVALACIVAATFVIRLTTLTLNPDSSNWNGDMWAVLAAFSRVRVTKVTLLSLALPLAVYAVSIEGIGGPT